jgi:hypothetical protein
VFVDGQKDLVVCVYVLVFVFRLLQAFIVVSCKAKINSNTAVQRRDACQKVANATPKIIDLATFDRYLSHVACNTDPLYTLY